MKYAIALAILLVFSCKSQKKQLDKNQSDNVLTLLVEDGYSGIETFDHIVVHDQKALNGFFAKINRTRKPGIPVPDVDFSREIVVVVCAGEQRGSKIPTLAMVDENDKQILLGIKTQTFSNGNDTSLISTPFCVYSLKKTDKEIFVESF